jgi:glutamyl-tRNA reductase
MEQKQQHIHCIGINHHTASVAVRERIGFTPHRLDVALSHLGCGEDARWDAIQELVILSTCNRVELYAVATCPCFGTLEHFLSSVQGVPVAEFAPSCYQLLDEGAIHHLLRVAAGLDSLVLGEPQILGQVADAYSKSRRHRTAGKILSRLFQGAIHAGKRSRSETAISHNPASISSVAVKLISETVSNLERAEIMVLGAGEMAELAVEALRKRGGTYITVVNRTYAHAQALAQRWNGSAASLESLPDLLPKMDVVITSTGAPHTIVHPPMVEQVMQERISRPLVFMDIAVPRDVDAEVGSLKGVKRYDMDMLSHHLEKSIASRMSEIPKVERILSEEMDEFLNYLRTLNVVPLIIQMRKQANAIREAELEKAIRRMPELSPEAQGQLDLLTKSIVKKILHSPTIRLREVSGSPHAADYADITRGLFGLD